jgi:dolichol-phosphate mannosyltransferase
MKDVAPLTKVWILLPAFNEEKSLPVLLLKIRDTFEQYHLAYHIIVCDDGSNDNTPKILREYENFLNLSIIVHKINRGLGETVRDLFEQANEMSGPQDVIVRMDCDDTHDPGLVPLMITKLNQGYDVVIASRFQPGGGQIGVNKFRSLISMAANLFMRLLFPIKGLKEYSCGYRAYRASIIKKAIYVYENDFIQLKGLGFTCTLEKLVKLKMLSARFAEVPFVLRYDLKKSQSKMIANITTLGYITMAILYYWPWKGWRNYYKKVIPASLQNFSLAQDSFSLSIDIAIETR